MYDVIVFGGTTEGREISAFLGDNGIDYLLCVATDYGAESARGLNVTAGRLDCVGMKRLFCEHEPSIVIDATHPYACEVTKNIKNACGHIRYIRVKREEDKTESAYRSGGEYFSDIESAVEYLKNTAGNILITTGSKDIAAFAPLADRAYARVLPSERSIRLCLDAGFEAKRIICMQGPFCADLNGAFIRALDIKYLVTKNSGETGGFSSKISAAADNGALCVIIDRPREKGVGVSEAMEIIEEWRLGRRAERWKGTV